MRDERLDSVYHAEQVHPEDALPVLRPGLPQRMTTPGCDASVVDDDVDPAEVIQGPGGQRVNTRRVANVGDHRQ
jgi:hypothetical protein